MTIYMGATEKCTWIFFPLETLTYPMNGQLSLGPCPLRLQVRHALFCISGSTVLVLNLDSSLEPPGDTLELAVGRSQSRPINTEFLGMEPRHQYCFKLSRYFQYATNTKSLWKEDHTCIWCQVLPVLFPQVTLVARDSGLSTEKRRIFSQRRMC